MKLLGLTATEDDGHSKFTLKDWTYSAPSLFQYDILYKEILKNAIEEMALQLKKDKTLLASN